MTLLGLACLPRRQRFHTRPTRGGKTVRAKIYADLQNADVSGRIRMNCRGTAGDLAGLRLELSEGLDVILYDEEFEVDGRVEFSELEDRWVAVIDRNALRRR